MAVNLTEIDKQVGTTCDQYVGDASKGSYTSALERLVAWYHEHLKEALSKSFLEAVTSSAQARQHIKSVVSAVGVPSQDLWPLADDTCPAQQLRRFMAWKAGTLGTGGSAPTFQAYRSAVIWLYRKFERPLPPKFRELLGTYQSGKKRENATAGARGVAMGTDAKGKAAIPVQLYEVICKYFASTPSVEGSMFWCFVTLLWHLMARSKNASWIHLNHLNWDMDALVIRFCQMKNDQFGERAEDRA